VAGLRRPVLSAWLVNLLVREHAEEIDAFLALGAAMRDAQQTLSGPRLRELSEQRRRAVDALERRARDLAGAHGHPSVDADTTRDVRDTLAAALADPAAARTLARGTLTHPLHPGDPAAPVPARKSRPRPEAEDGAHAKGRHERERRASDLADAHTTADRTRGAARDAREEAHSLRADLDTHETRHRQALARVEDLEHRLADAHEESDRLADDLRRARHEHERADKSATTAERAADKAREHLDRLRGRR